ncbi:DUF2537 domain-containing protein [Saccharopolyspora griseoalba]|uniref:DUF2537 domain-containing protein n=1 Tax=Saccharopolyspora griseoalba TaxID=1431848 RepID=A0ABW2LI90_9PSEU
MVREASWELRARSGRAVLVRSDHREYDPARLKLPEDLVAALHEWAGVAGSLRHAEAADSELVSRRGRHLATLLATETGGRVDYLDPRSGAVERIGRSRSATAIHRDGVPLAPVNPTPWGTGLTVSAIVAGLVAVILVAVTQGLGDLSPVLAVLVNLGVAAGFAPSIWLGRNVPIWRWVACGTAVGIVVSWLADLLSLLG